MYKEKKLKCHLFTTLFTQTCINYFRVPQNYSNLLQVPTYLLFSKIFMPATVISPHSIERADLFIEIQSRTFYRPPSQMYIYMCRWIFEQDYLTCKYACCSMVFQGNWYTNKKWMHLIIFLNKPNKNPFNIF